MVVVSVMGRVVVMVVEVVVGWMMVEVEVMEVITEVDVDEIVAVVVETVYSVAMPEPTPPWVTVAVMTVPEA